MMPKLLFTFGKLHHKLLYRKYEDILRFNFNFYLIIRLYSSSEPS